MQEAVKMAASYFLLNGIGKYYYTEEDVYV